MNNPDRKSPEGQADQPPEKTIEELAALLYNQELPYHNFDHAQKALTRGEEIVRRCHEEDVVINDMVVHYALLFHDAGYHEDHRKKGFNTKEEYSASLARQTLTKQGVDDEIIKQVESAIISTHRDAPFTTNEAKAVRAADLAGLAGEYEEFLEDNRKLKKELEMMTGKKISWDEWKDQSKKIVTFYFRQDIRLTSYHEDDEGKSIFHKKAQENLERFLQEDESALEKNL